MNKSIVVMASAWLLLHCGASEAMHIASFGEYALNDIRYSDRVRLSSDVQDVDFETTLSEDSNGDGMIDILETSTFVSKGKECTAWIGNASTRYDITNTFLWLGVDGECESFMVNDTVITKNDFTAVSSPDCVMPYSGMKEWIDYAVLLNVEKGISKRSAQTPIGNAGPLSLVVHSVISQDEDLRMYGIAYGAIKSGVNSLSSLSSDILFLPDYEEPKEDESNAAPVPEPISAALLFSGMVGCSWFHRHNKR